MKLKYVLTTECSKGVQLLGDGNNEEELHIGQFVAA